VGVSPPQEETSSNNIDGFQKLIRTSLENTTAAIMAPPYTFVLNAKAGRSLLIFKALLAAAN